MSGRSWRRNEIHDKNINTNLGHAGHHGPAVLLRVKPLHRIQAKIRYTNIIYHMFEEVLPTQPARTLPRLKNYRYQTKLNFLKPFREGLFFKYGHKKTNLDPEHKKITAA